MSKKGKKKNGHLQKRKKNWNHKEGDKTGKMKWNG